MGNPRWLIQAVVSQAMSMLVIWRITRLMAVMAFGVELTVDEKASSIDFEATEMFFIGVDGNFSDFSGTISVEGDTITAINGVITVLSLDTDNKRRDDHLLSSDFFHEVAQPTTVRRMA